jgi:hypothetical protein|tara:strand:- start:114 stop:401 length:288 start_codon:yes stop_codon:yes gene_type:complete
MDGRIIAELSTINTFCQFGIYNNQNKFIDFDDILFQNNKLYYFNNGMKISVNLLIKREITERVVNWLDYLYYRDGYGRVILFKTYLKNKYVGINV